MRIDSSKLVEWLQVVGNIAVLGGLILVAYEIKQSNNIAMAVAQQSIMENFSIAHDVTLNEESGLAELRAKLRTAKYEDLDEVELERLRAFTFRFWNSWTAVQVAYDQGLAEEEFFRGYQQDIGNFMNLYPAAKVQLIRAWESIPATQHWEIYEPIRRAASELQN